MEHCEVWVKDTSVALVRHGRTILEFTVIVGEHGKQGHVFVPAASQAEHLWETLPVVEGLPITVDVVTYEKEAESLSLPRVNRERAQTRTLRPSPKRQTQQYDSKSDTITVPEKNKVLDMVLKSLKNNPHQTKAEIAAETHRIAERCHVGVMAVAGVRANLTRGRYGNVKTLLRKT